MMDNEKLVGRVVMSSSTFYGDTPYDEVKAGVKGFIYSVNDINPHDEIWYIIFENGIGLDMERRYQKDIKFTGEVLDKKKFINKDYKDVCEKVKLGAIKIDKRKKKQCQ